MESASLLASILDRLQGVLWDPYVGQTAFWVGACWTLIATGVVGFISMRILYWRGRILQFFAPGKRPATVDAASPASNFAGCVKSALLLIALGVSLIALLGILLS